MHSLKLLQRVDDRQVSRLCLLRLPVYMIRSQSHLSRLLKLWYLRVTLVATILVLTFCLKIWDIQRTFCSS